MPEHLRKLLLASGSSYRRSLLQRIYTDFQTVVPDIDESPRPAELPAELASRLARSKALVVAGLNPKAIVIGSDQVADLNGLPLGKPGTRAVAVEQLKACAGQQVVFHTAVCICCLETGFEEAFRDETTVEFRSLSQAEIAAYLDREQPWDCAGSFKSEGLGPVLFRSIQNQDPTALVGLPLIRLAETLRHAGLKLL